MKLRNCRQFSKLNLHLHHWEVVSWR